MGITLTTFVVEDEQYLHDRQDICQSLPVGIVAMDGDVFNGHVLLHFVHKRNQTPGRSNADRISQRHLVAAHFV